MTRYFVSDSGAATAYNNRVARALLAQGYVECSKVEYQRKLRECTRQDARAAKQEKEARL